MAEDSGPTPPHPRTSDPDWAFTIALFVVALLPRLIVAIDWATEPVWDGHYYDFGARRLAQGAGYSDDLATPSGVVWHPWCHYPVGYSGLLAVAYLLFGPEHPVGTVVGALIGAATAVVVHRLCRHVTTLRRARIAGGLCALSPGLVLYAGLLMTEPLAGLGLVTAPWLVVRWRERRPWVGLVAAGLVLGLTTLVRPQSILVAPLLAALASRAGGPVLARLGHWMRRFALVSVVSLAVVAPWTVRNCRVMDGCAFVSTNGGWNLAIGSFPRATGRFETLRAGDGCDAVTGQVNQDRCWWDRGVTWIVEDPARWLGLMPDKLAHTFDHESFAVGYLAEGDPERWPEERRFAVRGILSATHRLLLGLAALGVIAWPIVRDAAGRRRISVFDVVALLILIPLWIAGAEREGSVWPIALFIPVVAAGRYALSEWIGARWVRPLGSAAYIAGISGYAAFAVATLCVIHAVFFGEDRYHVVLIPLLAMLAACALRPVRHE